MSQETQKYQSCLNCCGSIWGFLCCTYQRIETSSIGLREKFGKFVQNVEPGLRYYNPFSEEIKILTLKTRVVDIPKQIVYTKDNMSVLIDTSLFFRVVDPFKATYVVKDVLQSLTQLTFVTLRTICGQYVLQELLTHRKQVNDKIQDFIKKEGANWGVYVENILMKDMVLSSYLSQNLSRVSKTKRLVQSKIISAKADLESAKLYREAADILDIAAAVQIRFLETLQQMQLTQSKKVVILPLQPDYQM